MGAMLVGDTIYISKELSRAITKRERKVLLAHEISHYYHKDHIKNFFLRILSWFSLKTADKIKCNIEARADREAIQRTKDPQAFKTLLYKLKREGTWIC